MNLKANCADIISVFTPFLCPICKKKAIESASPACEECRQEIRFIEPPFCPGCGGENSGIFDLCAFCLKEEDGHLWKNAVSLMHFEGLGRQLVHRFKYQSDTALAKTLGNFASERLLASGIRPDIIVPVPLHWISHILRGYNQSELLASFISRRTGIPVSSALRRRKWTRRQANLGRSERRENIIRAFSVKGIGIFEKRSILIIDDVITTGATLRSAAKTLLGAGAGEINILTLARG